MGYNVSPEVMAAFREKNAAESAWNRKRIIKKIVKWATIIGLIVAAVVIVMRTVRVNELRKTVAGTWDEFSRLGIEEVEIEDDSRFIFTMYDDRVLRGTYKIGPQCSGAVQKSEWSPDSDTFFEKYICIDFMNGDEVVIRGMYDIEDDELKLFSSGSWSTSERIE